METFGIGCGAGRASGHGIQWGRGAGEGRGVGVAIIKDYKGDGGGMAPGYGWSNGENEFLVHEMGELGFIDESEGWG